LRKDRKTAELCGFSLSFAPDFYRGESGARLSFVASFLARFGGDGFVKVLERK